MIFYSNGNNVLGKKVKNAMEKFGLNVTYSDSLAMVADMIVDNQKTIVFIDKVFSKYAKIAADIVNSKVFNNALIVFIDDDSEYYSQYLTSSHMAVVDETGVENKLGEMLHICNDYISGKVNINMRIVSDILSSYLSKLGFSPKHSGYRYIKQCVEYAIQNSFDIGKSLYKETYLFVGKKNHESSAGVERNIRNAISQAYMNTGFKVESFECLQDNKVTNRVLLSYLVDRLSVDQNIYVVDTI